MTDNNPRPKRGDADLTGRTFEVKTASFNNYQVISKQLSDLAKKVETLTNRVSKLETLFLNEKIERLEKELRKLNESQNSKK